MQIFMLLLTLSLTLVAQDYQQGKIDMHGGKYEKYNSIGGYKDGGFRRPYENMSKYLDKNSSQTKEKKKNTSN